MKRVIYTLHGFLGKASDWIPIQNKIQEEQPNWKFVPIDFFANEVLSPHQSFEQWAKSFYAWMQKFEKEQQLESASLKRTLVGYSLGGRLALQLVHTQYLLQEHLWDATVLISTNPGLKDESEKLQRLASDKKWAEKFLNQDFNLALEEWNSQPVLKGSFEPQRISADYKKEKLSAALLNWSLALQKDFRDFVDLWDVRQFWIAGEKDQKFAEILKSLPESDHLQRWIVEGARHRLIFEAPEEIAHFIIRASLPVSPTT